MWLCLWLCCFNVSNFRLKHKKIGQYSRLQRDCFLLNFRGNHWDLRPLFKFREWHFEVPKKAFEHCSHPFLDTPQPRLPSRNDSHLQLQCVPLGYFPLLSALIMIGKSIKDYVIIRIAILALRLVASASLAYLAASLAVSRYISWCWCCGVGYDQVGSICRGFLFGICTWISNHSWHA